MTAAEQELGTDDDPTGQAEETDGWIVLRMSLWPATDEAQHRKEMAMMLSDVRRFAVFVCPNTQGVLVGSAEVSLQAWAEGCESSPVARSPNGAAETRSLWGVMGLLFGPSAIPFALLARPKRRE